MLQLALQERKKLNLLPPNMESSGADLPEHPRPDKDPDEHAASSSVSSKSATVEVKMEEDEDCGYENDSPAGSDREEEEEFHPPSSVSSRTNVSEGSRETGVKGEEIQDDDESSLNGKQRTTHYFNTVDSTQ